MDDTFLDVNALSTFTNSPLFTGIVFYVVGFAALTAWENIVVPTLQLNSILPDIPLRPGELTQQEKAVEWLTPYTASLQTPPPDKEDLKTRGKHPLGKRGDVRQFITLETKEIRKGVCEVSPEWSEYYDDEVTIFKDRIR
jgi:hypothetical protein